MIVRGANVFSHQPVIMQLFRCVTPIEPSLDLVGWIPVDAYAECFLFHSVKPLLEGMATRATVNESCDIH